MLLYIIIYIYKIEFDNKIKYRKINTYIHNGFNLRNVFVIRSTQ